MARLQEERLGLQELLDESKQELRAMEQYVKRLLAAGYGRIFQICRCHRKHERGDRHLPEMTLLEWYQAGQSLGEMMALCEVLIGTVARQLGRDTRQGRRRRA